MKKLKAQGHHMDLLINVENLKAQNYHIKFLIKIPLFLDFFAILML